MNLYDKYGDSATVSQVVTGFYGDVMHRQHLRAYSEGVPMAKLIEHQVRFMSMMEDDDLKTVMAALAQPQSQVVSA